MREIHYLTEPGIEASAAKEIMRSGITMYSKDGVPVKTIGGVLFEANSLNEFLKECGIERADKELNQGIEAYIISDGGGKKAMTPEQCLKFIETVIGSEIPQLNNPIVISRK